MSVPRNNTALPSYAAHFSETLTAAPATYGASEAESLALAERVAGYLAAQSALVAEREAGIRSEPLRVARDTAKHALLPTLRSLYGRIQKDISISDQDKITIGVHLPRASPSRNEAPTLRPKMGVVSVFDRTITVSISDPTTGSKRSRPKGAVQALVYYFAGANYPSEQGAWSFAGVATGRTFAFTVPPTVAGGTRVWMCASYTNRRGDAGPTNVPISTSAQGGAVTTADPLKIAA